MRAGFLYHDALKGARCLTVVRVQAPAANAPDGGPQDAARKGM